MLGISVWYHLDDRQAVPVNPEPAKQVPSPAIEVYDEVRQRFPMEHIEAVIDEATQLWGSDQDGYGTMVVITPRRIAVVLDKQANRGAVVPVDSVYPKMEDAARARVHTWLDAPSTRLHVTQIRGSWFLPYDYDVRTKVVDPGFIRTNMTYDAGFPS